MIEFLSEWTNSIGSSIVMIFSLRSRLILSIIAASDVDLPDPVWPVTRTSPDFNFSASCTAGGKPSMSICGTSDTITRSTIAKPCIMRYPLTRNRWPSISSAKSTSPDSSNLAKSASPIVVLIRFAIIAFVAMKSSACKSPVSRI